MKSDLALQDHITRVLADQVQVELPSADTDLLESGLLDSLTLVKLIVALEAQFAIEIPLQEVDLEDFRCLASLCELVESKRSAALAPAQRGSN